jgi:glycosyltransferase involved in cell wall biosynthesis
MTADPQSSGHSSIRVLMTTDAVGGVWQYSLDLISQLSRESFEFLLAVLGPPPSEEQLRRAKSIPGLRLAGSEYPLEWMPDAWAGVDASGKWLLDLQESFHADLVHLNGFSHAALPWGKPVAVVAHSCVRSWWRAVHGCEPGAEWDEYARRVAGGLNACHRIIAPSRSMAECLRTEYGIAGSRISVIHNFAQSEPGFHIAKAPFILAAGRIWDPAKNLEILNRIGPQLDWEVCIAGSTRGPDSSSVAFENVTALGPLPRSELLAIMESAAIYAHPALYEPFGLSVLEAAQAGCCLVLSDIPSLRELWNDAAVFIDPRNPDAWLSELNRLARETKSRTHFAACAQASAGRYSAHSTAAQYAALYRSLAGREEGGMKGVAA